MISGQLRILLLLAFLFTTTLVVVLQYNSNKNIEELVTGNEELLEEFEMKSNFQTLQSGLHSIDNNIRRSIISTDSTQRPGFEEEKVIVRATVTELGKMLEAEKGHDLWNRLDSLAEEKISFSDSVIELLSAQGPQAAENLINTGRGISLNEDIGMVTNELDKVRQTYLTQIVKQTDANSLQAKQFGFIMAAIAAAIVLFTFLYIVNHIRKQQQLIAELNESEKKVREAGIVKEHFIANMSHEIRTPMNAILGFTNLLQKQPLGNMAKQYVGYIQGSGETLLGIINDVLDLSKIEAGMMRIEKTPFSLRGLLQSVQTMFLSKAEEKKLELGYSVDENIADTLNGDAVRLTQILVNLVSNAIKFTAKGFVSVQVTAQPSDGGTALLRITVADSGIGIAKDKLGHVFERFTQAEENTTRRFGGTGLGLSIVQQLVSLLGGTITVTSEPGSGSFFTIEMPFEVVATALAVKEQVTNKATSLSQVGAINILVVEDNPMNQQLMRHLLDGRQMKYDIAGNGKEAMDILAEKKYDLVLMDVQMPEMDGYTAARLIRDDLKLDTPIIAMTAHAFAGEREKCISFGMNDYLSKPIKEDDLFTLIAAFANAENLSKKKSGEYISEKATLQTIDLAYLHELSGGNTEFEQEILKQFVTQIPDELSAIQLAYDTANWLLLKNTAHNLKTTVSFLGLHQKLVNHLDELEKRNAGLMAEEDIKIHIDKVLAICGTALEEAALVLGTLEE